MKRNLIIVFVVLAVLVLVKFITRKKIYKVYFTTPNGQDLVSYFMPTKLLHDLIAQDVTVFEGNFSGVNLPEGVKEISYALVNEKDFIKNLDTWKYMVIKKNKSEISKIFNNE